MGIKSKSVLASFTKITRQQHGISRRTISNNALQVMYRLKDAGYAAYLVGGAVRDLLLDSAPKDFDLATNATPEQVRALFRNCRLIGRRFRLAHILFGDECIEVATFRAHDDNGTGEREIIAGRIVRDNVYGSIAEDALRRDFTANALYYAIDDLSLHDYVGGFEDVKNRILRLIGDPEARYREDPVRMLRAIRLSAKLGFKIEQSAWKNLVAMAPLIVESAPARLLDELLKLFFSGAAVEAFSGLQRSGLLQALMPMTLQAMQQSQLDVQLVTTALKNTDLRLRQGKSVTPSFLLAALLWPSYRQALHAREVPAYDIQLHMMHVAQRIIQKQHHYFSIPKRFAVPMIELWLMQPRFTVRTPRKVKQLLAHPRFRAAYDFLLLRAGTEAEAAQVVDWWTEIQSQPVNMVLDTLAKPKKKRYKKTTQNKSG